GGARPAAGASAASGRMSHSGSWQQHPEEFFAAEIVGNHVIRTRAGQPLPLPFVKPPALRLVRRYPDRNASRLLYLFDLDVSVAESDQLIAGDLVQNSLHQQSLGKSFRIVQRTIHAAIEIARHVE